jgi:2-(1,2-epoxy-1,2-dihydrophenyl)acetyl-CoA isomerase
VPDYKTIRYEAAGGIGVLTINRPNHFNGMTNTMLKEARRCMEDVVRDPSVRVLVLTGEGRAFCPGADLKHYTAEGEEPEPSTTVDDFHVTTLFHEAPQVTIAAVNGACAGAGFGWACACDLRFAAASANFSSAFLKVAVAGDMGGPWTLPRIVGPARARELYFLPEKFGAAEAERIGLVSKTFPDDDFRAEVDAIARRLASSAPVALRAMKENFLAAERLSLRDYITYESERHARIVASDDTREAFRAFVEKREPRFASLNQ